MTDIQTYPATQALKLSLSVPTATQMVDLLEPHCMQNTDFHVTIHAPTPRQSRGNSLVQISGHILVQNILFA